MPLAGQVQHPCPDSWTHLHPGMEADRELASMTTGVSWCQTWYLPDSKAKDGILNQGFLYHSSQVKAAGL